jgi:sugar phosphate isomerase/epimerase
LRRREVLSLGLAAGLTGLAADPARAAGFFDAHPVGLQMFSILDPLDKDFEGTLRAIAAIGYREVETIGGFGRDPAWVGERLKHYGLTSPSQHLVPGDTYKTFDDLTAKRITLPDLIKVYLEVFRPDRIVPVIEEGIKRGKAMGQTYVVWPILFESQLANIKILDAYVKAFNIAGDLCAREGMGFAYHNHTREFRPVGSDLPYDIFLKETDPDKVKFELDYFWMANAGIDPASYLKRYPGRFPLMHLKDRDAQGQVTDIGLGSFDFRAIVAAGAAAGVEHFYVERDDPSSDPMSNVRTSFKNLMAATGG